MAARTGKQTAGRTIAPPYGADGDPAAVATVRRIFDEFLSLYAHATLSEIAHGLTLDEVPTKRGGRWTAATVRYILRNASYAGAVVSEDTFTAAQTRLQTLHPGPPQ